MKDISFHELVNIAHESILYVSVGWTYSFFRPQNWQCPNVVEEKQPNVPSIK
jgi:hypothetical protein